MKRDNLVFDVGMHRGEDTELYLTLGYDVVAFEADPDLIANAQKKFTTQISNKQLTFVAGAIVDGSSAQQTVTFYRNPEHSELGTVLADWKERNEALGKQHETFQVPTVSFPDALSRFGVPYYLKIDVEGCDMLCLESLWECSDRPEYVSIESNKTDFTILQHEIDTLRKLGYRWFQAVQQRFIPGSTRQLVTIDGHTVEYRFLRSASGPFGPSLEGDWCDADAILEEYRRIFVRYQRWGDATLWKQNPLAKKCLDLWEILSRRAYPGWYDTHARL